MKVLVACEESQRVCTAFREKGHEAYSCDIIDCSGGHPEWHIKQDVLPLLNGRCTFGTCDGQKHEIDGEWDLIIAHPPCTYLSNVATRSHSKLCTPIEKIVNRTWRRLAAAEFFMRFVSADCERIAVENPIGIMNTAYRKPDQIIHPYQFADNGQDTENYVTKATCLWLKGLPELVTNTLQKPNNKEIFGVFRNGNAKTWEEQVRGSGTERSKVRSKTFPGIAKSMAEQWGGNIT